MRTRNGLNQVQVDVLSRLYRWRDHVLEHLRGTYAPRGRNPHYPRQSRRHSQHQQVQLLQRKGGITRTVDLSWKTRAWPGTHRVSPTSKTCDHVEQSPCLSRTVTRLPTVHPGLHRNETTVKQATLQRRTKQGHTRGRATKLIQDIYFKGLLAPVLDILNTNLPYFVYTDGSA